MVQRAAEAKLDSFASNDQSDLDDTLSDHFRDIWICIRPVVSQKSEWTNRVAICDQFGRQLAIHAVLLGLAEYRPGDNRHRDCLAVDHLVHDRNRKALSGDCVRSDPVFRLGIDCDVFAGIDLGNEPERTLIAIFCEVRERPCLTWDSTEELPLTNDLCIVANR